MSLYSHAHSFVSDFRRGLIYSSSKRELIASSMAATAARLVASPDDSADLEHIIAHQSSALAPIRTTPLELLTYIFSLASNDGISLAYVARESPWNIARVCKYWRDIFYSTPSLWCYLMIDWNRFPKAIKRSACSKVHVERLASFLSLSSNLPISLHMGSVPEELPVWRSLNALLLENKHRWAGKVAVRALHQTELLESSKESTSFSAPQILQFPPRELPSLRILEIEFEYQLPISHMIDQHVCTIISQCSTMSQLVWRGDVTERFLHFAVSAENSLRAHPNLDKLSIRSGQTGRFDPRIANAPEEVVIERIHTFEIENTAPWVIDQYLSHISLPSLTNLSVWHQPNSFGPLTSSQSHDLADTIEMFLDRSGCQDTLHSLSYRNLHPDIDLTPILEAAPNVVDLTVASLSPGTLESPALLPKLRKITVDAVAKEDIVMPAVLVEILALRHPGKRVFSFKSFKKTWAFVKDD
ncbi:hypothetical protein BKA70DRAFT_1249587 [Coprinopsis sp. MPI-PUGE-AT-0042]|nr:hypothetical protein BKA70DRAFT_1249587 [Coprinopsis sp. MPI-PUGE-AT-0042]